MDNIKRINLWSGPRNISTALMYSFAQRTDTTVVDEPLYAYYLANTNAKEYHPGAEDILDSMDNNGDRVMETWKKFNETPVLFLKQMTHHLLDLDREYLKGMLHIILTRDPKDMLPSYADVIDTPSMNDVGYALHLDLINDLKSLSLPYVVLDSRKILQDPESELRILCEKLSIPFQSQMLSWQAGPRPEDGIWAPYWYDNVHKSTGFQPYKPKTKPFPEHLNPLLNECQEIYAKLVSMT